MTVTGWSPASAGIVAAELDVANGDLIAALGRLRHRAHPNATALSASASAAVIGAIALADDADRACALAIVRVGIVRSTVDLAGWSYGVTDAVVRGAVDLAVDTMAYGLGAATRAAVGIGIGGAVVVAGLLLLPLAALTARNPQLAVALANGVVTGAGQLGAPLLQGLQTLFQQHGPDLVNDPAFSDALAHAVDALDSAAAGFLGLPGLGLPDEVSLSASATGIMLLGLLLTGRPPRLPGSVPVHVVESQTGAMQTRTAVDSYASGFDRIQGMESNIEIDRYVQPDGTVVWQVFAGGTESFGLDADETAYDMTSNLENATNAGGDLVGSAAAVELAMEEAGIADGDVVQLFGYSQGGAAVAAVAAYGRFRIDTVVSYAGPTGATPVPPGTTAVAVQNASDAIAHAGGTHDGDWIVLEGTPDLDAIETDRYDDAGQPLADLPVGGHYPEAYADTAAQLDELDDTVVQDVWQRVDVAETGPITSSSGYQVER